MSVRPDSVAAAPRARIRARGPKDMMDRIISKINTTRPKNDDGGTFKLERSTRLKAPRVRYVLKTGIEPFDALTNYIAFGRTTEIYGLETSGKTSLARVCLVQSQKREIYECVYDNEDSYDYTLKKIDDDVEVIRLFLDNEMSCDRDAKMMFPDPATGAPVEIDCALGECDTVEQMFKIFDNTIDEVEAYIKETGKPCLMVAIVDTIAGTASKEEMSRDWGIDDYPRQPKQLREGFRKLSRRIAHSNVCLICTNQVSEKYQKGPTRGHSSTPQEGNYSASGGRALKYWSHLRIFTFTVDMKYTLVRGSKFAAGYLVGFFIKKNRRAKPLREGRMALIFEDGYGLDPTFSKLETLIYLGFAEIVKSAPYDIRFKFAKWEIPLTTFGGVTAESAGKELEEEDDRGRKSDPRIQERAEWPDFYRDHKADFDAMWAKAIEYAFSTEGISDVGKLANSELDEMVDEVNA